VIVLLRRPPKKQRFELNREGRKEREEDLGEGGFGSGTQVKRQCHECTEESVVLDIGGET